VPFADDADLAQHFEDHKAELPAAASTEEYAALAEAFLFGARDENTLECFRPQGGFARYNQVTQEYGTVNANGFISTYMIPSPAIHGFPSNLDYFRGRCR